MAQINGNTPDFDGPLSYNRQLPRPTLEEWRTAAGRSLRGRPLELLTALTHENIEIKPLYTAEDLPGGGPYVPSHKNGGWESCVAVELAEPEEAIRQAQESLSRGANSIWIKVDRRSRSWGRLSSDILGALLETTIGVPIYIDGRGVAPTLAALLFAAAKKRGIPLDTLRGGADFDPLGTIAADGALPWPLDSGFRMMAEMVEWTAQRAPLFGAVAVSTIPYVKAGATAVDELALALATGVEYLRRLDAAGVAPDVACQRMRLVMPVGRDFIMEIAKLRAARRLWATIAEACGVGSEGRFIPIHVLTSPRTLTVYDPWVNLLRGTVESFAGVVGGADVLTVLPFDSAIGQSDEFARRIAVNTSTILREESHLDRVADPAAGSYYVERLTHDLAADAWSAFQHIESAGGMALHLRSGAVARELGKIMSSRRKAITTRRDVITGVSSYPQLEPESVVRERLHRDDGRMPDDIVTDVHGEATIDHASFTALVEGAEKGHAAIDLVNVEPGDDEPERIATVEMEREAQPFEDLRNLSDRRLVRLGYRPSVFLSTIGPQDEVRTAITYITHALATAGIVALHGENAEDTDTAVAGFSASGSRTAIICASGEGAPTVVPGLATALKAEGARRVMMWGRGGEHESALRAAGVDGFIHAGCDVIPLLEDILEVERVDHD